MAESKKKHIEIPLIFILQKGVHSLKTIHRHLVKRGNHVFMSTDIRQFVLKALQEQPNFIFIPMDHQNQLVKNLPNVLGMKGNWTIIPYIENQSTSAAIELKKLDTPYFIIPPLSGPKFERIIKKVVLDLSREDKRRTINPKTHAGVKSSMVKIDTMKMVIEGSGKTAQHKTQFNLEASRDADFQDADWLRHRTLNRSTTAQTPEEHEIEVDEQNGFWQELEYNASELRFQREQGDNAVMGDDQEVDLAPQEGDLRNALRLMRATGKIPQGLLLDPDETPEDSFERLLEEYNDHKAQIDAIENTPEINLDTKANATVQYQSILHAGAAHALDIFKQSTPNQTATSMIQSPTEAICLILDSKSFTGYMIAVAAKEYLLNHPFEKILKIKLNEYLKENSIEPIGKDAMKLSLKPAPFNEWVQEQAHFLTKSVYDGSELAIAFFPMEEVEPVLKQASRDDLVSIELKELKGDIPVDFDLYLYLEHNNKYIKYTPQGMVFQLKQWNRLSHHGITEMYLAKDSIKDVRRYRAQNFLNDKIEEYMKKFRSASAA